MKKISLLCLLFATSLLLKAQTTPEIKNIAFYLQDGVEILDFAGPMEVFLGAGFNVYTVAKTKAPIKAMQALTIVPDYSLEDAPKAADVVAFFGGGGAYKESQQENILAWVKGQTAKADICFSVCTGAFYLGEAGLLDGKTATTFHSSIPDLRERFPKATVRDDVRFVDNGSVITTGGISAGIDGALYLVSKLKGKSVALRVAENMEYFGWQPEKGLVIESPFVRAIWEKGMAKALEAADKNTVFYKGELLNLGNELFEDHKNTEATAVFDFALQSFPLSADDCAVIGKCFTAAGRKVPPTESEFLALVDKENWEEAHKILEATKAKMPNWNIVDEGKLNDIAYQYLAKNNHETAIHIFQLNVAAYPSGFNTYDSLGEAYFAAGKMDLAKKNYEKSIELNPQNKNGFMMLEKIKTPVSSQKK